MSRTLCSVLLVAFLTGLVSTGVEAGRPKFSLYGGYSLPVGDYGSADGEKAGYAEGGIAAGVIISMPVAGTPAFGLSLAASTGFILSGYDTDAVKDEYTSRYSEYWEDMGLTLTMTDISIDADRYLHIPVMFGVSGSFDASPGLKAYGLLLAGMCFSKFPDISFPMTVYSEITSDDFVAQGLTEHFDVVSSFCFSIGAGVLIRDRFEAGVQYLDLGKPSGDGKTRIGSALDPDEERFEYEQSVSMILFTIGVRI